MTADRASLKPEVHEELKEETFVDKAVVQERSVTQRFLEEPTEDSFTDLFKTFNSQLVAFFRARGCQTAAEDLAQEVMLTVYRKAGQVRVHTLFRPWLFKIARHALYRHFGKQSREVETVDLADAGNRMVEASSNPPVRRRSSSIVG